MNKILRFVVIMMIFGNSVLAANIDLGVVEEKLATYDVEANAKDVAISLYDGTNEADLTTSLEVSSKADKLKAIGAKLSVKINKKNFVTLGEVELASQDGVQVAGPLFLNSSYIVTVLGWIYLYCHSQ